MTSPTSASSSGVSDLSELIPSTWSSELFDPRKYLVYLHAVHAEQEVEVMATLGSGRGTAGADGPAVEPAALSAATKTGAGTDAGVSGPPRARVVPGLPHPRTHGQSLSSYSRRNSIPAGHRLPSEKYL